MISINEIASMLRRARWLPTGLATAVIMLGASANATAEHSGASVLPLASASEANYVANPQLEGRLAIAGSDTMRPLLTRLAGDFIRKHPKVKIAVEGGGSALGIRKFIIGTSGQRRGDKNRGATGYEGAAQVTVLASSRELTGEERGKFSSRYGYVPLTIPIAMDAVAIYVHKDNPLASLTLEQVDGIFSSTHKRGTRDISKWGQAGLGEAWAGQPIRLYGRDRKSGTRDFFQTVALDEGSLKTSVNEAAGSANEVLAIARDPQGIGYAGVGFEISGVRMVPLTNEPRGAAIFPTADAVAGESYPLSRPLYLYVNQEPNTEFDPVLHAFLKYVNSPRGQAIVVSAKAYPLSQAMLAKNEAILSGAPLTASARNTSAASE